MKEIGNLAIVCANRKDVLLSIQDGMVSVFAGAGPERTKFEAQWNDNAAISDIVHELNFGKFRETTKRCKHYRHSGVAVDLGLGIGCTCNNDPYDIGECVYGDGIIRGNPICKYYEEDEK